MTDTLVRLVWALPLVLLTGLLAVLMLKRVIAPDRTVGESARRLVLRESLSVSDQTRMYLVEVDRHVYLLVESAGGTVLQSASASAEGISRRRSALLKSLIR